MSIEKLNACIKYNSANHSRAREAIYNLLLNSQECLNVSQILKKLSTVYPKKISQNTLYRHLNFFVDCKLTLVLQDNYKRAYYYPNKDSFMAFCICTRCNNISKLNIDNSLIHKELESAEFISVHQICSKCSML